MARTKIRCEVIWKSVHERPVWEHTPVHVPIPPILHITLTIALSIVYSKECVDVSFLTRQMADSKVELTTYEAGRRCPPYTRITAMLNTIRDDMAFSKIGGWSAKNRIVRPKS